MTTLAANTVRDFGAGGYLNHIPVIASDIIYSGAAVGVVVGTGHARPLAAGDIFAGFANAKADNSSGAAADINVEVRKAGVVQLAITGAVITDIGQPVYATDDDTFVFTPVSSVFIGYVERFISTGVVEVRYDVDMFEDPYANYTVREAVIVDKTLDAQDTGKLLFVTVDAKTITLPAIADGYSGGLIVNGGAFGTVAVNISPDSGDMILGPDITGSDDKDLINTKATAKRNDLVQLGLGDADGYVVLQMRGTWAREG
jgi:hypothetical protein